MPTVPPHKPYGPFARALGTGRRLLSGASVPAQRTGTSVLIAGIDQTDYLRFGSLTLKLNTFDFGLVNPITVPALGELLFLLEPAWDGQVVKVTTRSPVDGTVYVDVTATNTKTTVSATAPFALSDTPDEGTTYGYDDLVVTTTRTDSGDESRVSCRVYHAGLWPGMNVLLTSPTHGYVAQEFGVSDVTVTWPTDDLHPQYNVELGDATVSLGQWVARTIVVQDSSAVDVGNQNDVGLGSETDSYLWDGLADATFGGMTGGTNGRVVCVVNRSDTYILFLLHEHGGSQAANRFLLPDGTVDSFLDIRPGGAIFMVYDGSSSRWRLVEPQNSILPEPLFIGATDLKLNRLAAGALTIDSNSSVAETIVSFQSTSGQRNRIELKVGGDIDTRTTLYGDATEQSLWFGSGTDHDWQLARTATNVATLASGDSIEGDQWTPGYAEVTADQGSITTAVDLTNLSVAFTVISGHRIRITGQGGMRSTVATDAMDFMINEGGTQLSGRRFSANAVSQGNGVSVEVVVQPSAGAHTYKLRASRAVGTGTVTFEAGATYPGYILVEDIGV